MEKPIKCPLINDKIDTGTCFDICMVCEGLAPERTLPGMVQIIPKYKDICNNCKNHKED